MSVFVCLLILFFNFKVIIKLDYDWFLFYNDFIIRVVLKVCYIMYYVFYGISIIEKDKLKFV